MPDQNTLHAANLNYNFYCGWNPDPSSQQNRHGPCYKPQS